MVIFTIAVHFQGPNKHPEALMPAHDCRYLRNTAPSQSLMALPQAQGNKSLPTTLTSPPTLTLLWRIRKYCTVLPVAKHVDRCVEWI